jgi:hypothetical protein
MVSLMIVAWAAALAAEAAPSGCGWFGFELASPAVEVRGADVRLASPLRIVRVADGSPAAAAGLRAGMEIRAIDGESWDAPGFLPNVVRLQTAAANDDPRFTVARDGVESEARVRAAACSGAQLEERARLLATLGRMEGASWDRYRARRSEQEAEAADGIEEAIELADLDEKDRANLEDSMDEAARALRDAEAQMSSPEIRRRIDEALRAAEQEIAAPELERRIEQSMRDAQKHLSDPESRRQIEEALRDAEHQVASSGWRDQLEDSIRTLEGSLEGLDASGLGAEALEEARVGMQEQLEQMQHAREAASDARRFEASRIQDEVRRALEEANVGRDERRRALLEASRATRHVEATGRLLEGADLAAALDAEQGRDGEDVGDGAPGEQGLRVRHLDPGSALARAGVEEGDRIVRAGGMEVFEVGDLFEAILHRLDDEKEPGAIAIEVEGASGRRVLRLAPPTQ